MQLSSSIQSSYQRRQPEQSILYQIIDQHYDSFVEHLINQEKSLPYHVQKEFLEFLRCGRLEHGFLRVGCETCQHETLVAFSCKKRGFCPSCGAKRMVESAALLVDDILPERPHRQWVLSLPVPLRVLVARDPRLLSKVLKIIYRQISSYLMNKAGATSKTGLTGAVTYIQFFGGSLNLNPHFHLLVLDGVFLTGSQYLKPVFKQVAKPNRDELQQIVNTISLKVIAMLEKQGLIERDLAQAYFNFPEEQSALDSIKGLSASYRIALGPNQGKKVLTLQTLPARADDDEQSAHCAQQAGFSLHAGVATKAHQKQKLERICRYVARPAVSEQRLSILPNGNVRLQLKTCYRNGTTHLVFEPLDFLSKLASIVPPPRMNLTRFHGVYAPNHKYRGKITPAKRGKGNKNSHQTNEHDTADCRAQRKKMTWAMRLKRVFNIDIEVCPKCHGKMKVIACIEDPAHIKRILDHLNKRKLTEPIPSQLQARAPPKETDQSESLQLNLFEKQ